MGNVAPRIKSVLIPALVTYAATVILSLALSAILVFAAASALSLLFGGSAAGSSVAAGQSPGQPSASDIGNALGALLTFGSYTFFASHFGPLEASGLGGATYSVIGVGSLTIAGAALLFAFVMTRRIERTVPERSAGPAFLAGAVLGAPYGLGAVALYVPSVVTIGSQQLGISVHASLLGVLCAAAVAGLGGGMGAASIRIVRGAIAASMIRGVARGTAAIAFGAVLSAVVTAVWIGTAALTQPSASTASNLPSASPVALQLGWSLVALIPFYFFNAIALIWSATLDGSLFGASSVHFLIYLGPVAGALIGALKLRGGVDRLEQASYAVFFGAGTGVVGLATTPAIINGPALLPNLWIGVLVALVFGAGAALAAPYLLAITPVRAFAGGSLLSWITKPVLGIFPAEVVDRSGAVPSTPVTLPRLHLERLRLPRVRRGQLYLVAAVGVTVLLSSSLFANAQLGAQFSPEAAALNYVRAQGRADADAMWPLLVFDSLAPAASSRFLTKDALTAMLAYSGNRDITNVSVASAGHQDDVNYTIAVHLTRAGQPITIPLHVRRDQSRSNWVVYPYWRVVVAPSVVQIRSYPHAGEVTLDGIDTGTLASQYSVVVIPGLHRLQLASTGIFAGETKQVDASGDISVAFDVQLVDTASAAATTTLHTFFQQCAGSQQLSPAGCPNSTLPMGDQQSTIHWTLVGDPSTNARLSRGDAGEAVIASGTWKMHVSYDYWFNLGNGRVQHWDEDISGDFTDSLLWNGSGFDITNSSGSSSSQSNGTSSVPSPSINAVPQAALAGGGHAWQVVGQYFTPREQVFVYLYDPSDAPTWIASFVPGVSVRPDGSFTVSKWLLGGGGFRHGTAMIKACDTANVCATVLVTLL